MRRATGLAGLVLGFAGVAAGGLAVLVLAVMARTLIGAGIGWIVGLVFGGPILGVVRQLGVETTMPALGACLGFAGGFVGGSILPVGKKP